VKLMIQRGGWTDMSRKDREDYRTRTGTLAKARWLRGNMTEAEKRLWYLLRGHVEAISESCKAT